MIHRIELAIDGMVAVHCVRAVETALVTVPGITFHEVTVGRVVVEHDGQATEAAMRAAVALAGFTVRTVATGRRLPTL
ncbi:MAG: hypothetical protein MUF40_03735 [Gemmatimonadaceae bacterium]|jgi:copper chaperone CopZ|nr:hypothetical protein [Gemmatimonadaceae bacterium]